MRVGVITFHRACNYGAVLQCFALQEVIRSMGHEVEIIDYRQPYIENKYNPKVSVKRVASLLLRLHLGRLKQYFSQKNNLKEKSKTFTAFRNKFLRVSNSFFGKQIPQKYECYIIGSDQMWGLHCTGGYDSVYWGNFVRSSNSKLYGYAISANLDYHEHLTDDDIKDAVKRFNCLSFREQTVSDDIERTTGYKSVVCIDPTLLTDASIWEPLINEKWSNKKFVAMYLLRCDKKESESLINKAKIYATEHQCDVIDVTSMKYSVEDFVSIIKYARCVFTTSFHATVFSLIFNTPFYSFMLNDGHDGRYANLLIELGLASHLFAWDEQLRDVKEEDPLVVRKKLSVFQKTSREYINQVCSL